MSIDGATEAGRRTTAPPGAVAAGGVPAPRRAPWLPAPARVTSGSSPLRVLAVAYLSAIHVLSAVVWVGGMFFALIVLRPAVGPLEPPARLALWRRVFARFFPAVGIAAAALLATGHAMILVELGGFAAIGMAVHLMQGTGVLMVVLYLVLLAGPYRAFLKALDAGTVPAAGRAIERIRWIIAVNLALGVATIAIATTGRYWG